MIHIYYYVILTILQFMLQTDIYIINLSFTSFVLIRRIPHQIRHDTFIVFLISCIQTRMQDFPLNMARRNASFILLIISLSHQIR